MSTDAGPKSILSVLGGIPDSTEPAPPRQAVVDCAVYLDGDRLPGSFDCETAFRRVRELERSDQSAFVWLGLHEPDRRQMDAVAATFGLHPLAVEDAVQPHQRPKVERYDDSLFVILKTVHYVPHESVDSARKIVETGDISIFVGRGFLVAVRHGDHTALTGLRHDLESERSHLALGPYGVLRAITQHVVDTYLDVGNLIGLDIDVVEAATFSPRARTEIEPIYLIKRDVLELRRSVGPLTDALTRITTDYGDLLSAEAQHYMRDVLSHQTQAADQILGYDEMLTSLVQAALARVELQQNLDMRKISAWVAIAAVPTMIAGIYGMNFDVMPELHWIWGYPAVLTVMATVCGFLYYTFRRNSWL